MTMKPRRNSDKWEIEREFLQKNYLETSTRRVRKYSRNITSCKVRKLYRATCSLVTQKNLQTLVTNLKGISWVDILSIVRIQMIFNLLL